MELKMILMLTYLFKFIGNIYNLSKICYSYELIKRLFNDTYSNVVPVKTYPPVADIIIVG